MSKQPQAGTRDPNSRPLKRGYFLFELILVLALISSLIGGIIGLVSIVQASEVQAEQHHRRRQEIRRLANDLRQDVRQALENEGKIAGGRLELGISNGQVSYQVLPGSTVRRSVMDDEGTEVNGDTYSINNASIKLRWLDDWDAAEWTITLAESQLPPIRILAARKKSQ